MNDVSFELVKDGFLDEDSTAVFTLDDDGAPMSDKSNTDEFMGLEPKTYALTQTSTVSGYALGSIDCGVGTTVTPILDGGGELVGVNVVLNAGDDVTCVFTNSDDIDMVDPVITCPAAQEQANDQGECTAQVSYPDPTATDDMDNDVDIECDQPSGSTFPVGDTTVTCTATDNAGNEDECQFLVTVTDDEPAQGEDNYLLTRRETVFFRRFFFLSQNQFLPSSFSDLPSATKFKH